MLIREINQEELVVSYNLMIELRTHITIEDFFSLLNLAKIKDEYKLVGLFHEKKLVALMGFRILYDFVHGKHLYIDDLVVSKNHRSKGFGKELLNFANVEAQNLGHLPLRLCTGIENEDGMRFYEQNGWKKKAVVYKYKLGAM